jgi:hypothetical protein
MRPVTRAKCYGKGTNSKPACPIPECDKKHAEVLHDLLTKESTAMNMLGCEEDEDEEGCVNIAMGEDDIL